MRWMARYHNLGPSSGRHFGRKTFGFGYEILANEIAKLLANWLGFLCSCFGITLAILSFSYNIFVGRGAMIYVESLRQNSLLKILNYTLTFGWSAHLAKNNVYLRRLLRTDVGLITWSGTSSSFEFSSGFFSGEADSL